jgi:hypothetical protein
VSSDYPDYQTPQAHATAIANTGVPLLANPVEEYGATAITVPPGTIGQIIQNLAATDGTDLSGYLSYEIRLLAESNAASAAPFLQVDFEWYGDAALTQLLYRDEWYITCGDTAAGPTVYGTGPVRGGYLQITVGNIDTVNAITITDMYVYLNSRPAPFMQPDWRTAKANAPVPGYSVPGYGDNFDGLLGQVNNGLITAGGTVSWIFGLFNGVCDLSLEATGTAPNVMVQPNWYSPHTAGLVPLGPPVTLTGATLAALMTLALPRYPLIVTVTELGGIHSASIFISAIAQAQL